MLDEFLSHIGHEIRGPMSAILGYAELLSTRLKDPTDQHYVNVIRNSGEQLVKFINDLIDISRMDAGTFELHRESVGLIGLIEEVNDLMLRRAQEKQLGFSVRCDRPIAELIEADRRRLHQILVNLVSNAIRFTECGSVDLHAGIDEARGILEIEVTDTGLGITPEDRERLRETFAKLNLVSLSSGKGFGLIITSQLVRLMGGKISCQSEPGKGSCFRVTLPVTVIKAALPSVPETVTDHREEPP